MREHESSACNQRASIFNAIFVVCWSLRERILGLRGERKAFRYVEHCRFLILSKF